MPSPPDVESKKLSRTSDASPLDLFTTLARTGLFVEALQRECLSEHGLTFTEFSVLRLLHRAPGKNRAPSFLAKEIVCTSGAMTKLVDRLERAGFVERTPDPDDRRGVLVTLTAEGLRLSNAASASYREGRRRVLAQLKTKDAQQIQSSLERLLSALEVDRDSR